MVDHTVKRLLLYICSGLIFCALSTRPTAGESLRLASYNLKNLYDIHDDPYSADEDTPVKPYRELILIAKALKSIDADVIAVQEIENEGILKTFVRDFLPELKYHTVFVSKTNSTRGGNLGLISRKPVLKITSHRYLRLQPPATPADFYGDMTENQQAKVDIKKLEKLQYQYARDLLQIKIQATAKITMDLFVVHFKSKRSMPGDPEARHWRFTEAAATTKLIRHKFKGEVNPLYCLLGDINDTPDSFTVRQLLADPDMIKDAHDHLSEDARVTYPSKKYGFNTIDYMLVSPALHVYRDPKRTQVLQDEELTQGSDHRPIIAEFKFQ